MVLLFHNPVRAFVEIYSVSTGCVSAFLNPQSPKTYNFNASFHSSSVSGARSCLGITPDMAEVVFLYCLLYLTIGKVEVRSEGILISSGRFADAKQGWVCLIIWPDNHPATANYSRRRRVGWGRLEGEDDMYSRWSSVLSTTERLSVVHAGRTMQLPRRPRTEVTWFRVQIESQI